MKYKIPVLAFWLIFFNFACHHRVQNDIIPVNSYLIADTVCSYPYSLSGNVILKNGHIFMVDPLNAGEMYIYNIQTGQMDNLRTENPNYFTKNDAARYTDALSQHLPLSYWHSHLDRYFQYTLENDLVKLNRENLRPARGTIIIGAEQLTENKFVMLGLFSEGLLALGDKVSKEVTYYGHTPVPVAVPLEGDEIKQKIANTFLQGNIAWSDIHSMIVYGSSRFAYLSCYHFTGKKLIFQWEKHIVQFPANQIVDNPPKSNKTVVRSGVSDVAIAGDYIFAGYTQKNENDIPEVAHSILVYDMKGNLVATFYIDYPISGIMVDVEAGSIYGISREDEPVIVRFRYDKI